jgi:hypothetical protein
MVDSEAIQVTRRVTHVLDDLGIPYVIGGSMASIVHGLLRTTMDVDIVADLSMEHIDSFVAGLQSAFYADKLMIQRAIQHHSSFNLIHLESMFKVDIFIPTGRPFDQQQLNRRIAEPFSAESGRPLWILSAEDIILAKLDWFRMGGEVSERQWRDILGVLKIQKDTLDLEYLRHWAVALDVTELLTRALESTHQ